MIKVLVSNQKGGVGKTTYSFMLAIGLKKRGYNVLLVNTSQQNALNSWVELIYQNNPAADLPNVVNITRSSANEEINKFQGYDYIIVDSPGTLLSQSWNIIAPMIKDCDLVVVPITPSPMDVWDSVDLIQTIKQYYEITGKPKHYYFLGMRTESSTIQNEIMEAIKETNVPIMKSYTSYRVAFKRSVMKGQTIFDMDLAEQGFALTDEVIEICEGSK